MLNRNSLLGSNVICFNASIFQTDHMIKFSDTDFQLSGIRSVPPAILLPFPYTDQEVPVPLPASPVHGTAKFVFIFAMTSSLYFIYPKVFHLAKLILEFGSINSASHPLPFRNIRFYGYMLCIVPQVRANSALPP